MNDQTRYEFREDNIKTFRIDRLFIRDDNNNRITYTAGSASEANKEYTKDLEFNTVTFASDTVSTRDGMRVEVQYIPESLHQLVITKAALYLQDQSNVTNAEVNTPTLGLRLLQRVQRLEKGIQPNVVSGSEDEKHYDPTFGDVIRQRRFRTY